MGKLDSYFFFLRFIYLFMIESEREAETQAEGEAGPMHREPDVGLDPGSLGSRPGPKAGAKLLRHPGIPQSISIDMKMNRHGPFQQIAQQSVRRGLGSVGT